MKINKIILITLFLCLISLSAVSASDDLSNLTAVDSSQADDLAAGEDYYTVDFPDQALIGEDDEAIVTLPDDCEGRVEISIDDYIEVSEDAGGQTILAFDDEEIGLELGTHTAFIDFISSSDKYPSFNMTKTFEYTYMKVTVPENAAVNVDSGDTLDVKLANDAEGSIQILIDGKSVYNKEYENEISYDQLYKLAFGAHTYEVRFTSTDKDTYESVKKSGKFNVIYDFELDVADETVDCGDELAINIILPDDVNAKVKLTVNGEDYTVDVEDGWGTLVFSDFKVGDNQLKATFKNSKYPEQTVTAKVFCNPAFEIPESADYGESAQVKLTLPGDANGVLTVKLNGENYTADVKNGVASVELPDNLDIGDYTLEAGYTGDYDSLVENYTGPFHVNLNLNIPSDIGVDEECNITLTAPESYGGVMTVYGRLEGEIDYETLGTADIVNGKGVFTLKDLEAGVHQFSIGYNSRTYGLTLTVHEESRDDVEFSYPDIIYADLVANGQYLTSGQTVNGKITVYVDDEKFGDWDGLYEYEVPTSDLALGDHVLKVVLKDDAYFNDKTQEIPFKVINALSYPKEMMVGAKESLVFDAKVPGYLTLTIKGVNYYNNTYLKDGKATVSLENLPITEAANISVTFRADDPEIGVYKVSKVPIVVKAYTPKITGAKDISMYYLDGTKISVKVYNQYGKVAGAGDSVKFTIGSKTYYTKTDKKGIATLKIVDVPKSYKMKITYKTVSVTKKLKVKQVVTLKTVKVKKSARNLVLSATLKKGKTPLKNKKVTFRFNGKYYLGKTNKKGVAKVTVWNNVLGKLKVGKKVSYQVKYQQDIVKKTVKVNK